MGALEGQEMLHARADGDQTETGRDARFNTRLAFLLAHRGLLREPEVAELWDRARRERRCLDELVLERQPILESALAGCVAADSGLAPLDLRRHAPSPAALRTLTTDLARYYRAVPLARTGRALTVAVGNPYDALALDDIRAVTGLDVVPVVSTGPRIRAYLEAAGEEVQSPKTRNPKPETRNPSEASVQRLRNLDAGPWTLDSSWPTLGRANEQIEAYLQERGAVSAEALAVAREVGSPREGLGGRLVAMGAIDQEELAQTLAGWRRAPYIEADRHEPDPRAVQAIPEAAAARYGLVPLDRMGEVLTVATCHHLDESVRRAIERHTDCRLAVLVTTVNAVHKAHAVLQIQNSKFKIQNSPRRSS